MIALKKKKHTYLVYFPRCVGYANSVMSIGAGWTTSIDPMPTKTLENTNMPYWTEAAWMAEAMMMVTAPMSKVNRRPILSDSIPTKGSEITLPID